MVSNSKLAFLARIIGMLLGAISEPIAELLESMIRSLYKKAKATENEFDDAFVEFLADVLKISLE